MSTDANQLGQFVGQSASLWPQRMLRTLFDVQAAGDLDPQAYSDNQDADHPYPIYSNSTTADGLYGFCRYATHRAPAVTVTARGTLGVCCARTRAFTAIGRVLVLTPIVPLSTHFYAAILNSRVRFVSESTGVPQLTAPQVARTEVAIPPLEEQRAIAVALNDVDALIAALDALIAKKRDVKQATMQQLLTGKTRLPGFSGAWNSVPLGHAGVWMSGGTPSKSSLEFWNGSIPWVSAKDMKVTWLRDSEDHVTSEAVGRGTRQVQPGTILIVVRGMILAHSVPVAMATTALCFNQDLKALVADSRFHREFVLWWLVANERRLLDITSLSSHGTKRIAMESLNLIALPLPPLAEQTAIAEVLTDLDAELAALEARRDKTRLIKQGMMQALLTGQVRLV